MRRSRFPMKRQPSIPVRDLAARHIVTDARTAGSEQRGSEASRLLLVSMKDARMSSNFRIHMSFLPVLVVERGVLRRVSPAVHGRPAEWL